MKIRMPLIAACLLVLGVGVPRSVHADCGKGRIGAFAVVVDEVRYRASGRNRERVPVPVAAFFQ